MCSLVYDTFDATFPNCGGTSLWTVIVFGVGSVLLPPFAVPPSSCTWKVNEVSVAGLAGV